MTEKSYDVRIWATKPRRNAKGKITSYGVRWRVADRKFYESFKTLALADSFRSELMSASRKGESFFKSTGKPVSMERAAGDMSWYEFACAYVDMKWPHLAGNSRKGVSEALITATPAMFTTRRGIPEEKTWRRALHGWAFNVPYRSDDQMPAEVSVGLRWMAANTQPVSTLEDPTKVREILRLISTRQDGQPAAASVVRRKRAILHNAFDYAVELQLLSQNPFRTVKWSAPKTVRAIDKRTVVNHEQAIRLLDAVREQEPSGPRLVGLFAAMYYSALRPAEAANLRRQDIVLPDHDAEEEWGELLVSGSSPETGARWSDSGKRRDVRQLKHRGRGEVRPVPCPPPLTRLLREHLAEFPPAEDGLIFQGIYTRHVSGSHYAGVWRKARQRALSHEEANSPLARRPYDLRHAAVSTWLNSGVPPTQVAEWAGHSVAVLLQVYAKCIAGQEEPARRRIEEALQVDPSGVSTHCPQTTAPNRQQPDKHHYD